jgi:hypothetical protein
MAEFSHPAREPHERHVPDFVQDFDGSVSDYPDFEREETALVFGETLVGAFESFPDNVQGYLPLPYIPQPWRYLRTRGYILDYRMKMAASGR